MGANSAIQWTDHTFNPWWGCIRVSPACEFCYAETFAKRYGHDVWGPEPTTPRRFFSDAHWNEPRKWNAKAAAGGKRPRVFCASMADVFEARADLVAHQVRLFELIEATPALDWLLLTKRPENMLTNVPLWWRSGWPANVWAGTTVEDRTAAEARIPALLKVPATVRFLSCEPLLGPLDLRPFLNWPGCTCEGEFAPCEICDAEGPREDIHWVIGGGESASKPERYLVERCQRPAHEDGDCPRCHGTNWRPKPSDGLKWARSLRDQCEYAEVAFLWKQWGGPHNHSGGRILDGREHNEFPAARELVTA